MGTVLYEAAYQIDMFVIMPIILFLFSFLVEHICLKYGNCTSILNWRTKEQEEEYTKGFSKVFRIIVLIFACGTLFAEIKAYRCIISPYKNNEYKVVEGYVEDFKAMPYTGHSFESFSIMGVEFSYSDYGGSQGYRKTASHGGVITHNGQHLKIGFVEYSNSGGENTIVYIEQLPE